MSTSQPMEQLGFKVIRKSSVRIVVSLSRSMVVGSALGAFAVARPSSPLLLLRGQKALKFRTLSSSSFAASPSRKLVLYSKPGCCLCDGLKEKLQAAFLISGTDSLHDVDLQIRDITTNPEWENAYQYEMPVLAKVLSDGTEVALPRFSPRLGVELLQKKIAAALSQQ